MNGFVKPEFKKAPKVDFEGKLTAGQRFKYKYLNGYFFKKLGISFFKYVMLIGISYIVIFPFISKISTSFMSVEDFVDVSVNLVPKHWTLLTYKAIIAENNYWLAMRNTAMMSLMCGILQTISCALVGYGFAKFKFRGKSILFAAVILTMIVPHQTIRLSMFTTFRYFDIWGIYGSIMELSSKISGIPLSEATPHIVSMMDKPWPLVIMSSTCIAFKNGLYIFYFRQFFRGVPDELEEAAYIDGAGVLKTFVRIILPMSIPMLVTVFMFSFSWQWTDQFYVDLFYPSTKSIMMPDIIKIPSMLDTDATTVKEVYETAIRNTCGLMILAPLLLIYLFAQRTLIQGIERSGITG